MQRNYFKGLEKTKNRTQDKYNPSIEMLIFPSWIGLLEYLLQLTDLIAQTNGLLRTKCKILMFLPKRVPKQHLRVICLLSSL